MCRCEAPSRTQFGTLVQLAKGPGEQVRLVCGVPAIVPVLERVAHEMITAGLQCSDLAGGFILSILRGLSVWSEWFPHQDLRNYCSLALQGSNRAYNTFRAAITIFLRRCAYLSPERYHPTDIKIDYDLAIHLPLESWASCVRQR
jgi:hypothetical protein